MAGVQVNYFPSRFDPVRQSERFPENRMAISGARERRMLDKVCHSSHAFLFWTSNQNDMLTGCMVFKVREAVHRDDTERAGVGAGEQFQAARG